MLYYLLISLAILLVLSHGYNRPRTGVHRPRYRPGLNRITPPGHDPKGPFTRWVIGGLRWPWDVRPIWLWNEPWHISELPYGVTWADRIRSEITKKLLTGKRH
jgi:hypothetical protein